MATKFDLIGIIVKDMGTALGFYRRVGLDIPASADTEPHVEHVLPGGIRLAFDAVDTIQSFDPEWTPASGGHRIALAFACDSPAEVDAVYADLTAAGYEGYKAPFDAFWGQRYATVHDPDGNAVEFFAALPGSA